MSIVQIVMIGLIGAVMSLTLKQISPQMALGVSIVTGVIIFTAVLGQLAAVVELLNTLSDSANLNQRYMVIIMRILGIAYIAQFGMEMCKDAGENAIASKIEIAGKVLIMTVSIPIITGVAEVIATILP